MPLRSSTCAIAVALTAILMMVGAVQATDDAKYPNWKGAWARWAPSNSARAPGNGGTGYIGFQAARAEQRTRSI